MLETKCVGENFEMLVTVSVKHQHQKDVANIEILSPTSRNFHQDKVTNILFITNNPTLLAVLLRFADGIQQLSDYLHPRMDSRSIENIFKRANGEFSFPISAFYDVKKRSYQPY